MFRHVNRILVTLFFIFKPIYFSESGKLQIADMMIILMIAINLLQIPFIAKHKKILIPGSRFVASLAAFLLYACLVNLMWFYINGDKTFFLSFAYLSYNLVVIGFYYIVFILDKDGILKATLIGISISIIISTFMIIESGESRAMGGFNNPNQLGYYYLVILCFLGIITVNKTKLSITKCSIMIISIYLVLISMSRAAILGLLIPAVYWLILRSKSLLQKAISLTLLTAIILLPIFVPKEMLQPKILRNIILRMERAEYDNNLLYGRGYARLFETGYHIIWGLGEGDYDSFVVAKGVEVHSTWATALISYGIIGFILFLNVFITAYSSLKERGSASILIFWCGVGLYWLSHNGIRSTVFWMLFSISILREFCQPQEASVLNSK